MMGVICEFELAMTVYDHITYSNYQCNNIFSNCIVIIIICKIQIVQIKLSLSNTFRCDLRRNF